MRPIVKLLSTLVDKLTSGAQSQLHIDADGNLWVTGITGSAQLPSALGPTTPSLALSTVAAQSTTVCTWQVTAGTSAKPLVPIWITATAYLVGEPVTINGAAWYCSTAGTSGATGPTGTTTSTDGTVTWTYIGPVATAFKNGFAAVNQDTTSIVYYGTSPTLTTIKGSAPLFTSGGSISLPCSPALFNVTASATAIVGVTACV